MQLIFTTSFPTLISKAFSALNFKIINRQIVIDRQRLVERVTTYLFPEIILSNVIFHEFDITCSIVMWNWYFSRFTFLIRALRIVPRTNENVPFGIGLSKNLQRGSHPSFRFQTRRFSFGTTC